MLHGDITGAARQSDMGHQPTVSVVIPTLNEFRNLTQVFSTLPDDIFEVVLVDGWSTDGTVEEARRLRPDVRVVVQPARGKGNALACGFHACRGDIIVMIDADCSTDPAEIPRFVDSLVEGADFAKGSRFVPGGGSSDITRLRRHGNRALNGLVNLMYRTEYTDLCYGYNAFWRKHLPVLALDSGPREHADVKKWGDGFEIETLINIRVAKAGLRIAEVPSFESERAFGVSNLNAVSDGLRVLRTVFSEFRRPPAIDAVEPGLEPTPGRLAPQIGWFADTVGDIPQQDPSGAADAAAQRLLAGPPVHTVPGGGSPSIAVDHVA